MPDRSDSENSANGNRGRSDQTLLGLSSAKRLGLATWPVRNEPESEADLADRLCEEMLERWRSGHRMPAEAYLARNSALGSDSEGAFELIYGEFLMRESLGESPLPEEFLWRFPQFADRLRRQLDLHEAITAEGPATEHDFSPALENPEEQQDDPPLPALPGYRIRRELGRGGVGVVYEAIQENLNRTVALKVIRAWLYADAEVAARFHSEAETAASFAHPNIIQVHEVGEHDGQGYIALEYAAGGSLQRKIGGTPQDPRDAANLVRSLALAVHYAHQRGVVHRDLKPANVVLTDDGIPKITDFGLAKLAEQDGGLTRTGDIIGTPCYMAPEQASGKPGDVSPRTDIYALGTILYEMLTGRPPFHGSTALSTLEQVHSHDPVSPGKLQRHTPRDLETICLKCLEKEPRKRYASGEELAGDLQRFLESRPIRARRISGPERVWRWCRREPVKAGLLAALVLVFVVGFVAVAGLWRRAEEKARSETKAHAKAVVAENAARDQVYFGRIAQARLEWRSNHVARAQQLLEQCETSRRAWEWHYLRNVNQAEMLTVGGTDSPVVTHVAFSPDGSRLAYSACSLNANEPSQAKIEVWDVALGRRLLTMAPGNHPYRLAFSPDGRRLVVSIDNGRAEIRDLDDGRVLRAFASPGSATLSPDGRILAAGAPTALMFWNADSGDAVREFPSTGGRLIYRPDGLVVAVSGPEAVEIRDAQTGREIRRLPHGPSESSVRAQRYFGDQGPDLAFSPDGRRLVVADAPPRIWDLTTGQLLHHLAGHDGSVLGVSFSPDGRYVATAGADASVRIWDCETGEQRSLLRGHAGWVACVAFHPGGWCLASGGRQEGEVKLWDLTRNPESSTINDNMSAQALAFSRDGRVLHSIDIRGGLKTSTPDTGVIHDGPSLDMTQEWVTPAVLADYSEDGRRLATIAEDRQIIKLWDPATAKELASLRGLTGSANQVDCGWDGLRVAAAGRRRTKSGGVRDVKVWDAVSGAILAEFRPADGPARVVHGAVALSPDGTKVAFDDYEADASPGASGQISARLRVYAITGGQLLQSLPAGNDPIISVAFSPDGRKLAASDMAGNMMIWDVIAGVVLHRQPPDKEVPIFRLAFSPDSRRLASADREKVRIWNLQEPQEVLTLRGAEARPSDGGFNPTVAWSPNGLRIASTNWNGSISLWDGSPRPSRSRERYQEARARHFLWSLGEAENAIFEGLPGAVQFHTARLLSADPPDIRSQLRRGRMLSRLGDRERARSDFANWYRSAESDAGSAWLAYARLLLLEGDVATYRQVCRRWHDLLSKDPHHFFSGIAAQAFVLAPGAIDDHARLVTLAVETRQRDPGDATGECSLALAQYRSGQYERALDTLRKGLEVSPTRAWIYWPVLAMIHHQLGQSQKAADWLEKSKERGQQIQRLRTDRSIPTVNLDDGIDFEILHAEAFRLLEPKLNPATPQGR
jgi:eukaryotic-like serine/threonine-protein kinase